MTEYDDIAKGISKWDWNYFFQVCNALGNQFNDASWRMMKGEVICTALEEISDNSSKYVDEIGYDLVYMGKKIEVKTERRIIKKNLDTKSIQLKNTRGVVQQFKKTFDYLLIINTEAPFIAALTTWEEVNREHLLKGDQIQCIIKSGNLIFLTDESGIDMNDNTKANNSLKEYMRNGIKKWIKEIGE